MSKQAVIHRYTLIIDKVSRGGNTSFAEIKDYLAKNDFEVSKRTIQRDIEAIRFEFGYDIKYNRSLNSYCLDPDSDFNTDSFLRFLEIVNTAALLTDSLKDSKDTLKYIMFESQGNLKGIEYLKPLLFATKNKRVVTFTYENFYKETLKSHTFEPYLLKEYQSRWYLIGMLKGLKEFRTFAVDRIKSLEVSENTFVADPNLNPMDLFSFTIGLTYSEYTLQDVILSYTPLQGKYAKSLPMHETQQVLVDNENELRVKLKIIPNFEFKQKILMLGDTVKVIEPKWLADDIVETLKSAIKNYK